MRAARFHGAGDIRIEDVPEPDGDLGPNDVAVAPRWCGICGTDLHEYLAGPIVTPRKAHALTGATLPQILGHEFAGDVLAVGSEVRHVRAGDRVSIMPLAYCGDCHYCRRGLNHLCTTMGCVALSWPWGGLAGRAVVRDYQAWPLPDAVSYEQGSSIEPAAVAADGVARGGVRPGDRVLVTGGGPIGAAHRLGRLAAGAGEAYLSEQTHGAPSARNRSGPRRSSTCGQPTWPRSCAPAPTVWASRSHSSAPATRPRS
jgi:(R,R)-butanediol dehydrogenase / meso-butanediol dehydrogenase / diacetyl reductase